MTQASYAQVVEQREIGTVPPKRIQRRRTKGWKMPQRARYVGRPTAWGNPYAFGSLCRFEANPHVATVLKTPADLVRAFREYAEGRLQSRPDWLNPLRGRNLACWCPLEDKDGKPVPCHADVLLEIANA